MNKLRNLLMSFLLLFGLCLFMVPVSAGSDTYVTDETGLLDDYQIEQLEQYAQKVSDAHNCGVYIRFIDSYSSFAGRVSDASEAVYNREDLGYGAQKDGILLLVSWDEGEYDLCAHGDIGNKAFTDHAKATMARKIESLLRSSDWYLACSEFISQSDSMLTYLEAHGEPFDTNNDPQYQEAQDQRDAASRNMKRGLTFGLPPIAALLTVLGLKGRNKNTGIQTEAYNYFAKGGIQLNRSQDMFINRTETRTRISRSSDHGSGGGTTVNDAGFSHSSGSFRN